MASRKLRHYFQECSSTVASEVPLNDIINNCDATGRIAKWAIELLPFDIIYKPRRAIKSQVLADFVTEWTEAELPNEYGAYSNWIMHFDGSKMLAGLGASVVLTYPTRDTVQYVLMLLYIAATHQVVSAVLVIEREEDEHKFPLQKPVYYVSTVLTPCKSWYPHYQKIA